MTAIVTQHLCELAVFNHERNRDGRFRRRKVRNVFLDPINEDGEVSLFQVELWLAGLFVVDDGVDVDQVCRDAEFFRLLLFSGDVGWQRFGLLFLSLLRLVGPLVLFLIGRRRLTP